MKDESYIKLFRKVRDWEHYQDSKTFHLYVHFILSAVRKPTKYCGVSLKPGQYLTTYDDLQEDTGLCRKYLSASIQKLCESGEIKKEMRGGRTLITVVRYEDYQAGKRAESDKQEGQPDEQYESGEVGAKFF